MAENQDDDKKPDQQTTRPLARREFLRRAATGIGALGLPGVIVACGSDGDNAPPSPSPAPTPAPQPTPSDNTPSTTLPTAQAWSFAIMADTQWVTVDGIGDDGLNPNSCAVDIISQLNERFIAHKVKFVVHAGDLVDSAYGDTSYTRTKPDGSRYAFTNQAAVDMRALFAQALYNAGIGLFPLRGNHDASVTTAQEFQRIFPQTQNGLHNVTPTDLFALPNPDADQQPVVAKSGEPFTQGSNFSSPSENLKGLSYAFDFGNARFILLDQFTTPDKRNADGSPYDIGTAIAAQQQWIDRTLAERPAGSHAFVFGHKGLQTQNHADGLFGDCSAPGPVTAGGRDYQGSPGMDAFIASLHRNGVRHFVCGHDHMHDRSLMSTIDGSARVMQLVCASDSNKFYYPAIPSNDDRFAGGKRQTPLSQERNTIGYYIVTVDGDNVSVDFHSAPAYPTPADGGQMATTPRLNFSLRERFGYGLNGREFIVEPMAGFSDITDRGPGGSIMKILGGNDGNSAVDVAGRAFRLAVNTGWLAANDVTASDILLLQGMAWTMGSRKTDPYVLSLSFDAARRRAADNGRITLATVDADGKWVNAVSRNASGNQMQFVEGPWQSRYPLGTYGIDKSSGTVWAVIDYNGYFAAVDLPV